MAEYTIDKIEYGGNIYNFDIPKIHIDSDTYSIVGFTQTTISGISGVAVTYDDGADNFIFLPDGNGFNTGSQAIINQIPTKTSDLTNDSGFITSYTDEKVKTTPASNNTTYYIMLADGVNTKTRQIDSLGNGLKYNSTYGTTSTVGTAVLHLGNFIASGNNYNSKGILRLYGTNDNWIDLISSAPTAARTITLPDKDGTLALNTVVTAGSSVFSGGLMSQADKTKLDSIASDAAAIQIIRWTESS